MDDDGLLRVERTTRSLRELTLEKLRDAILSLRFKPGERLVERTLCDRLGVSRTVVREVLRHLETEGLVEMLPNQGPVVARPDPDAAAEIYELRALLEASAAEAAARRASDAEVASLRQALDRIAAAYERHDPGAVLKATSTFYEILFQSAGKRVAWDVVQSLNARLNFLRAMTISTAGRDRTGMAEMRRIVEAIAARDPAAAHRASTDHVQSAARIAMTCLAAERTG